MHSLIGKINRDSEFGQDPEVIYLKFDFSIEILIDYSVLS